MQTANSVYFGAFLVTTDTLAALRSTKSEEDQLYDLAVANTTQQQLLSVIAFRGNIRSEATYIRSNVAQLTGGTGVVTELGLVVTLENGLLTGLDWFDFNECVDCGGSSSSLCVSTEYDATSQLYPQQSCAVPINSKDCSCRGLSCKSANCSTTVLTSFRGNSASGQSLESFYQFSEGYKYSVSAGFSTFFDSLNNDLGTVNAGPIGGGIASGVPASPLPLPNGQSSDAALAAAQAGQATPPPTAALLAPPPPAANPVPVPVPSVAAPAPVVAPSPPAAVATPVPPISAPPPNDGAPSPEYSAPAPSPDYSPPAAG